jgi:transketolase
VYLRLARDAGPALFDEGYRFVPGATYQLRNGRDVLIISTGPQTARCLEAARSLGEAGIATGVLHIPSIKPVDTGSILVAAAAVDLVVTVEEHTIYGGLGGLVSEVLSASLPKRVVRIGVEDCWGESAPNDFLLDKYGLSASRIVERIRGEIAS